MSNPYLLFSDVHLHDWDAFSHIDEEGVNSRLRIIIKELCRAYSVAADAGATHAFCAGDLFHVRGSIGPSVLLPVIEFFNSMWLLHGIKTYTIAGNHDLGTNEITRMHDMTRVLESCNNFQCIENGYVLTGGPKIQSVQMVGWQSNVAELRVALSLLKADPTQDLIIHAPVDEVLPIPGHGLNHVELAALGFKRVFVGHYHNHKDFGNGVYSCGATTHQTFSDIGTRAGFSLVYDDRVQFFESHAPSFIDLDVGAVDEADIPLIVDGHYVRVSLSDATPEQANEVRESVMGYGARGVTLRNIVSKAMTTSRSTTSEMDSLEESVDKYATKSGGADVVTNALRILRTVREGETV